MANSYSLISQRSPTRITPPTNNSISEVLCGGPVMFASIALRQALHARGPKPRRRAAKKRKVISMKTVWIYISTDALPGDVDYVQVFASEEAANRWIEENDPEGVAFEYPVQE